MSSGEATAAVPPRSSGKKTVLLRRRMADANATLPAGAITEQEVRERLEAAAQQAAQQRALQQQQEEQQRAEQHAQYQQQRQLLQHSSEQLSPGSRKALVRRVAGPGTSLVSGDGGLAASLPQSLALAAAIGIGPGSPGWTGPPRDARTGALPQWEVLGSTAKFEQAEHVRMRATQQRHGDDEEEEAHYDAQQRDEKESSSQFVISPSHAAPSRSSRLAQQLSAELALARRLEADEQAALRQRQGNNGALFEERLLAGQEGRVLAAHAKTQAAWDSFKKRAAARLGVPETQLNISRADEFRAKIEEADLLDKARPMDEKGAGREEAWAGSLRGIGHTYVPIGNMFTGLFTRVQADPNPRVEVIRRLNGTTTQAGLGTNNNGGGESAPPRTHQQGSLSQLAAPSHAGGKTWQHSTFLAARRAVQRKHISKMVSNEIVAAERRQIERGLPATADSAALDALHIRGEDLFALEETPEAEWYKQRMGGAGDAAEEEQDLSPEAVAARQRAEREARKRAKKAAAMAAASVPFDAPVQGPSLVASTSRLFFPLQHGPALAPSTTIQGAALASTGSQQLPGENDRVSRSVRLTNNGSTAMHFRWRKLDGVLESRARRLGAHVPALADALSPSPCISASVADSFFFAAAPEGTLLPGESVECTFTFLPQKASSLGGSGQHTGAFLQRLQLETEPKLPRGRYLTPWHAAQAAERQSASAAGSSVDDAEQDEAEASVASLVLSGVNTALDTSSILRSHLQESLVSWKNTHLVALQLHKTVQSVPEPPPPAHTHRALFYARNRDLKLFYYEDAMPQWHQLARDVFDAHKRLHRQTLVWDYSASMLAHWIAQVPARNHARVPELQQRYDALVAKCAVRPQPHPVRYEACFGLLSSIAAGVARTATALQVSLGISEPLEQDLRKAAEEKKRRADEEAKAKLPFHLRGGNDRSNANLTPEQKKLREEEAARKAEADAAQVSEDAIKLAERVSLTAQCTAQLEAAVSKQLRDAFAYFDFLAAPQNTNLDPQALHPEQATRLAVEAAARASEEGEAPLDVSVLARAASGANAADVAATSGKPGHRPRSGSKSGAAGLTPVQKPIGAAATGKGKDAAGAATADATQPTTPRALSLAETVGAELTADEQAQLAVALASPLLLPPVELETLRARSLAAFLQLERARAARFSTSVRSRVVYFGNGYTTPDTGVHIPTPAEIKLKEERERMARYGQSVGRAEKEAEERRQAAMHPMASLASRQVLLVASSALFSMVYTRERGMYAWAASDASGEGADEHAAGSSAASPPTPASGSDKKKGSATASGGASAAKAANKTRLQEARKHILGLHLVPQPGLPAGVGSGSLLKKGDEKASAAAAVAAAKAGSSSSKMSPRGSSSTPKAVVANKAKGASGRPDSGTGSGPNSARSTSPAFGSPGSVTHQSLVPAMPTALLPLGALCQDSPNSSPHPCYLPELQGLELVALSAGVHGAFLLTAGGGLLLWEHASRKVHTLLAAPWPGQKELQHHQWSERAVRAQMARDKAEGYDPLVAAAAAAGGLTARPGSRGGSGAAGRKLGPGGSGAESGRRTASIAAPTASSGVTASGDKKSSRKPGASPAGGPVGSNKKKGAHDEAEVLAVDSAAWEAEQERAARLVRDADFYAAGKQVVSVVVGGSGTLSAGVHYAPLAPAPDFEFVLLLTADGCVYSALVPPPAWLAAEAAAPPVKGGAGSAGGASGDKKKESEKSTAMLGVGEKSKEALKAEKEKEAAAKTAATEPASSSTLPLVQFELVQTLHPVTLSASLYAAAGAVATPVAAAASSAPVPVSEVRVVQISAGYGHATALCSDGSVFVWGNEGPHLAQGEKESKKPRHLPTLIPALQHITLPQLGAASADPSAASTVVGAEPPSPRQTAAAGKGVPALKTASGSAASTRPPSGGSSAPAKAGAASGGGKKDAKSLAIELDEPAGPIDPVVSVVCGAFHCLALTASGAVFSWGRGSEGQLGLGDMKDRDAPTLVQHLSPAHQPALLLAAIEKANAPPPPKQPAAGQQRSVFGAAAAVAASTAPTAPAAASSAPVPLSPFLKVVSLAAGGAHSLVRALPLPVATSRRDEQGNELPPLAVPAVWSFGQGTSGATGLGHTDDAALAAPVAFFNGQEVLQLEAGGDASQAIVARQASNAIQLTQDEDDIPNAVLV